MRPVPTGSRWMILSLLAATAACEVSADGPRDREAAGTRAMMPASEVDSIARTLRTGFTEWFERGGEPSAMIPAMYATDAILSDEYGRTHSGRAAIEASFQPMAPGTQIDFRSFGAVGSGDLIVDIGSYELRYTMPDGQRGTATGRYMTAHQRMEDGSWKLVRQLTTSGEPAANSRAPGANVGAAGDSSANRAVRSADSASVERARPPADTFTRAPRR